jgi:hypothetical protein
MFSTDFLFAMIIIVLGLGMIMATAELNMYNSKQKQAYSILKEKAEAGAIALVNSNATSCKIKDTSFPYSIDTTKLAALAANPTNLKNALALGDYNLQIVRHSTTNFYSINEELNGDVAAIDLNVLVCNSSSTMLDANTCINSPTPCNNANFKMEVISIRVGK